ncbi:hypothetical protein [Bacillus sp. SA1-12]|uniref:hypothetical protein n=1 Tax=Bacillus sp. SA1-12 TaxID=1455638 RepID=UPI0006974A53|nr:hypothetical protein [Bacillus sp. SA1-12]
MDALDIKILSHLQEHGSLHTLDNSIIKRSELSIHRRIESINSLLPDNKKLYIENHVVYSNINYQDYIKAIQSIPFYTYSSSQSERFSFIIIQSILKEVVNTTSLYEHLGLSLSTKKKDNRCLTDYLFKMELTKEIARKKGITIKGNETFIRIEGTKILLKILELDANNQLKLRQANNPMEVLIAEYFIRETALHANTAKKIVTELIPGYYDLSYPSKKFIYLYLILMLYRNDRGHYINKVVALPFEVDNSFYIVENPLENKTLYALLLSLDTKSSQPYIESIAFKERVTQFINHIQKGIITKIFSYNDLFNEVYQFIIKCMLRTAFHFNFYDNKLDETSIELPNLFNLISESSFIANELNLSQDQISTLTLIFRKHIMENKVLGRNTKNIVIVTNSSIEKANFFASNLIHFLDIKIIKTLHINELHELNSLEYDFIITFSNRLASLIQEYGFQCIKLQYYFKDEDINRLLKFGFSSSSRRKIITDDFIKEIGKRPLKDLKEFLINHYPSHFL